MTALENYIPNWNKTMADSVIANGERLFLDNGEHITKLVDSYYIVGTGESTYQTLEFTLNEERDSFVLETNTGGNNQNDVIFTETTDGDGTVIMSSATVFESFSSDRVFVKESAVVIKVNEYTQYPFVYSANHTDMLKKDVSTSGFIVYLINNTYWELDEEELYNDFRITEGYGVS